jgi:hypothetical protein
VESSEADISIDRVYTASFAFFEALWAVRFPGPLRYVATIDCSQAGITHVFVNLGSDHPSIIEAIVKGQNEKKGQFPKIITCPNEVRSLPDHEPGNS